VLPLAHELPDAHRDGRALAVIGDPSVDHGRAGAQRLERVALRLLRRARLIAEVIAQHQVVHQHHAQHEHAEEEDDEARLPRRGLVPVDEQLGDGGGIQFILRIAEMAVQIFGTKKCQDSRKAERWFKERNIRVQFIDLKEKGMSQGELRSVAQRLGAEALIDREGARYRDKGLKFAAPTGPRIEQMLLDDPLLLKTPVVRWPKGATVGYRPDDWDAAASAGAFS
jgi:arsenate reductase